MFMEAQNLSHKQNKLKLGFLSDFQTCSLTEL